MADAAHSDFAPEDVPAYAGLLDDFSLRFDTHGIKDVPELNRRLISAVLVGDPLLVNDGHVIMNPAVRTAVTKPRKSPFCGLVDSGFTKILTRNDAKLEQLADDMADDAISSAKKVVTTDWYRKTYQPALARFMKAARRHEFGRSFRSWPERVAISGTFANAAETAYQAMVQSGQLPKGDLHRFYDAFHAGNLQRRTEWEAAGSSLRLNESISDQLFGQLMQTASEAYQYAWGCALDEPTRPVRVQTRAPRWLEVDQEVGREHLTGPAEKRQVAVEVPVLDIAIKQASVSHWKPLIAATKDDEFLHHKRNFRRAADAYYGTGDNRELLDEAAANYTDFLRKYFINRPRFTLTYGLCNASVGAGVGLVVGPLGAAVGAAVGLGIGAITSVADSRGFPDFLIKISPTFGRPWLDLSVSSPPRSSFRIDPAKAAAFRVARPGN